MKFCTQLLLSGRYDDVERARTLLDENVKVNAITRLGSGVGTKQNYSENSDSESEEESDCVSIDGIDESSCFNENEESSEYERFEESDTTLGEENDILTGLFAEDDDEVEVERVGVAEGGSSAVGDIPWCRQRKKEILSW